MEKHEKDYSVEKEAGNTGRGADPKKKACFLQSRFPIDFRTNTIGLNLSRVKDLPEQSKVIAPHNWVKQDNGLDLEDSEEFFSIVDACTENYGDTYILAPNFSKGRNRRILKLSGSRGENGGETFGTSPLSDLDITVTTENEVLEELGGYGIDIDDLPVWGPVPSCYENAVPTTEAHENWYTLGRDLLRRECILFYGDDYSVLDRARKFIEGKKEIFAKAQHHKKGSGIICVPDRFDNDRDFHDFMVSEVAGVVDPYSFLVPNMIVQGVIYPQWETRFFVVDGKLVSCSGRVISSTPLYPVLRKGGQGEEGAFSPLGMKEFSTGEKDVVEANPHIKAVREHAQKVLDELNKEEEHLWCTIDVCVTKTGDETQPALVEANMFSNSGLYGNNIWEIIGKAANASRPCFTFGDYGRTRIIF